MGRRRKPRDNRARNTHVQPSDMKLVHFLAPLALAAAASAADTMAAKKKANFVETAKTDYLETCHPLMGSNTKTKPSFDNVKRNFGLSTEAQQDIIAEVRSNKKKFDTKSDKEILDLKALAEKFNDKVLVEKFA